MQHSSLNASYPLAGYSRGGLNPQNCSSCLNVEALGWLEEGRFKDYDTESITVNHSGYLALSLPPSLYVKDLLCIFRKRVDTLLLLWKAFCFLFLLLFQWQSKVVVMIVPFFPHSSHHTCRKHLHDRESKNLKNIRTLLII